MLLLLVNNIDENFRKKCARIDVGALDSNEELAGSVVFELQRNRMLFCVILVLSSKRLLSFRTLKLFDQFFSITQKLVVGLASNVEEAVCTGLYWSV